MKIKISHIKVGERFRKDFGDLQGLADSIAELGQLHPIGVDSNYNLIFGERRIKACELLGRDTVEGSVIHLDSLIKGEFAENEFSKGWTVSERVAILEAIETFKAGDNQHTGKQNFADQRMTVDQAAKQAGLGNKETARQAKKVVDDGSPELIEAVDDGRVSVSAAAMAATLDADEQHEIMEEINNGAKPSEVIKKHILATKHTGDEESYTPSEYIESARAVMGSIDIDPASNDMAQETVKAGIYYTAEEDGLSKDWSGNAWMNPPYTARVINKFIEKMVSHYEQGDVRQAIVLTNNNTDTSWFHLGAKSAAAICFTSGRINFLKRDGSRSSPTNGQAFFYFGSSPDKFKDEFSKHGLVMVKA